MRLFEKNGIRYSVTLEPEDIPIEGNAMASGDSEVDRETETWIRNQLDRGNIAAWCVAIVRAWIEIDGVRFEGSASLGCCSYESEAECEAAMISDDYGLTVDALEHLEETLVDAVRRGEVAKAALNKLEGA